MKRIGLIVGLVLVVFACGEPAGQMLVDGGQMIMDAGNMIADGSVPDAGADFTVTCDKSSMHPWSTGTATSRWAEFPANPGQTEVTVCHPSNPDAFGLTSQRETCSRSKAAWIRGTSTGVVNCGVRYANADGLVQEVADPISITVHD